MIELRTRSPLGAPYRSALGVFGETAPAPNTWTGGTCRNSGGPFSTINRATHGCGGGAPSTSTGRWDTEYSLWFLEFDCVHPLPYPGPPPLYEDLYTRTLRGLTSGAELRLSEIVTEAQCGATPGYQVWWTVGGEQDLDDVFFPNSSGYITLSNPVDLTLWRWGSPTPPFLTGESIEII